MKLYISLIRGYSYINDISEMSHITKMMSNILHINDTWMLAYQENKLGTPLNYERPSILLHRHHILWHSLYSWGTGSIFCCTETDSVVWFHGILGFHALHGIHGFGGIPWNGFHGLHGFDLGLTWARMVWLQPNRAQVKPNSNNSSPSQTQVKPKSISSGPI